MIVLDNQNDYREGTAVEAVRVSTLVATVAPLTDTAAVAAAEDMANHSLDLLRALMAVNRTLCSEQQHERRRTVEAECAPWEHAAAPRHKTKELCVRRRAEEGKEEPPPGAPMEEVASASAAAPLLPLPPPSCRLVASLLQPVPFAPVPSLATAVAPLATAVAPLADTAAAAAAAEDRAKGWRSLNGCNLDTCSALMADNHALLGKLQHTRERRRTAEAECAQRELAAAAYRGTVAAAGTPPGAPMEEVPSASAAAPLLPLPPPSCRLVASLLQPVPFAPVPSLATAVAPLATAVAPLADTAAAAAAAEDRAKGWRSLNGCNLDTCSALMADNHALLGKLQHTRERRRTAEAECAQRELAAAAYRGTVAAAGTLPLPPPLQPCTSLVGEQGGRSRLCCAQAPCTRGEVASAKQVRRQIAARRLASRFADDRAEVHMRSCYASHGTALCTLICPRW